MNNSMKKFIKSLLLIPALILSACNNNVASLSTSNSSNSELPSMSSLISSTSSGKVSSDKSSSPSTSSSEERLLPNSVVNSKWGLEAATASYDALGVAVPYIDNDGFDYEVGIDDFGDATIWFYAYYKDDDSVNQAFEDYIEIIKQFGYSGERKITRYVDYETYTYYEFECVYANRVILEHHGIELDFLVSMHNGKPCLGIYGFTYLYEDPNVFPVIAIEDIYGSHASDIPVLDGYKYEFMFFLNERTGKKILEIAVLNAGPDIEEEFFNGLLKNGCVFEQYDDLDDYYDELVDEYPGFEDQYYYHAYNNNIEVIFDFDIDKMALIIDLFELS